MPPRGSRAGSAVIVLDAVVLQLGTPQDDELAANLHSDAGIGLMGDLPGPLAGTEQRIRDTLKVAILALRGESCDHA
jgi:hypothetical protein